MSAYDRLAQALTRFIGVDVRAEEISCFDNFEIKDTGTDLVVKVTLEPATGNYYLYVSDFVEKFIGMSPFMTEEIEVMEDKFEELADCLDDIYSGLKRLDRISGIIAEQEKQLKITTSFNRASSYFNVFLDDEHFQTRNPNEMADKLEEYYETHMHKYINELNEKLKDYTRETFKFGENFEMYNEGLFLSIWFTNESTSIVNFHPGQDPALWITVNCDSRKALNEALRQILRRIQ